MVGEYRRTTGKPSAGTVGPPIRGTLAHSATSARGTAMVKGSQRTAQKPWYRRAADQGDARAQHNLGYMYEYGLGIPQDYVEAVRWYRKAAEQGLADAQFNLGTMYDNGRGLPQDYSEAARWYRKAAEQGDGDCQNTLGFRYAHGQGVPQEHGEAVRWYRKAADQGHAGGQDNLGHMCECGLGVSQDHTEAHMWLNLAASRASGDEQKKYADARELVAQKMTPAQIAEAQRRAREWQPGTR